jgi:hypothetical protein
MIGIHPHILEVVVLASGSDAFLRVCSSSGRIGATLFAQEYWNKLIHACVGKKKIWRLGHEARRGHNGVLFSFEKIQKILSDLLAGA